MFGKIIKKIIPATRNLVIYKFDLVLEKINSVGKGNDRIEENLGLMEKRISGNLDEGIAAIQRKISVQKDELMEANSRTSQTGIDVKTASEKICEEIDCKINQVRADTEILSRRFAELESTVRDVSHQCMYYCPYEVKAIEEGGFSEYRKRDDYVEQYKRLIRGLNKESIHTVNQILSRHQLVCGHGDEPMDLFTVREQEIITKFHRGFYSEMPEIVPGVFAC